MRRALNLFAVTLVGLSLGVTGAFAQVVKVDTDDGKVKVRAPGVAVDGQVQTRRANANADAAIQPWRASNIIGADIKNNADKSLGTVNDLVMDTKGSVHYVILAHGGVLGVGEKLVAIPLRAVSFHKTEDDGYFAKVNVAPELIEKARNFTSDTWPNFSDPAVRTEIDDIFVTAPGVKVNAPGVNVDVNR